MRQIFNLKGIALSPFRKVSLSTLVENPLENIFEAFEEFFCFYLETFARNGIKKIKSK